MPSTCTPNARLLAAVRFSSATIDDLAGVRHLVAAALERVCEEMAAPSATATLDDYLASPRFLDDLRGHAIVVARVDQTIVAIGAWRPHPRDADTAVMSCILVEPMFRRLGIGNAILAELEKRTRAARFAHVVAQSCPASEGLFLRHHYAGTGKAARKNVAGLELPVAILRKSLVRAATPAYPWSAFHSQGTGIGGVRIRTGPQVLSLRPVLARRGKSALGKVMH